MIFIDSNIPMYLVGASHPNKVLAQQGLEACIVHDERLVTDVEVYQEILHRYVAIARREAISPAFAALTGIVDEVFPVDLQDLERAKDIVLSTERLSARDALHIAVMARHGIRRILSFDAGFDGFPGITRLTEWQPD